MGKAGLLVLALCGIGAGSVRAGEYGEFQVAPYAGYSHLRIDGAYMRNGETVRVDQALAGVSAGYVAPFGLLVEIGRSSALHLGWFDSDREFGLNQRYVAVGYQFKFADGWRFTPRVGRMRWRLINEGNELIGNDGERHETLRGYENYVEASLVRDLSSVMSLGLHVKDVGHEFGHTRQAAVALLFSF